MIRAIVIFLILAITSCGDDQSISCSEDTSSQDTVTKHGESVSDVDSDNEINSDVECGIINQR